MRHGRLVAHVHHGLPSCWTAAYATLPSGLWQGTRTPPDSLHPQYTCNYGVALAQTTDEGVLLAPDRRQLAPENPGLRLRCEKAVALRWPCPRVNKIN